MVIKIDLLTKKYKKRLKNNPLKDIFWPSYQEFCAVKEISFSIKEGEIVGLIGPNGAGKTTTMKILSGLIYPSSGKVEVLDFTPFERKKEYLRNIGLVMGNKTGLDWDLTPSQSFQLLKRIYQISDEDFKQRVSELISLLNVENFMNVQVRRLSLGERMKMELIGAILHHPKVLFLDEPTIGLDVVAQKNLRDFIKEYNQKYHATIILTSHYMEDVKELCQRVIVIDKGKILYDGSLAKIVEKFSPYRMISVDFETKVNQEKLGEIGEIASFSGVHAVIHVLRSEAPQKASQLLNQFPVADLTIEEPPIEEVIRQLFSQGKDNEINI